MAARSRYILRKSRRRPGRPGRSRRRPQAYSDSLTICDRLAKADPGDAEWQRALGQAYEHIAYVDLKANQPAEARAALDAGRAIIAKLVADHPDFAQWKQDLAWFDAQIAALGK
ncbi:MAG: hypothetical protein WAV18_19845 [Roseiarcus sp.]